MRRNLLFPLSILLLAGIAFVVYVHTAVDRLPEHVATHFSGGGAPNGWMSRGGHEKFILGFGLGVPLFMLLVFGGIRALGGAGLNIPHREYWLAPERRVATLNFVQVQGVWFATLMLAFMAGIHRLILTANVTSPAVLPAREFGLLLGGFLVATGVWVFRLVRRFSRRE